MASADVGEVQSSTIESSCHVQALELRIYFFTIQVFAMQRH